MCIDSHTGVVLDVVLDILCFFYLQSQHSQLTGKSAICGLESSPDLLVISLVKSYECMLKPSL